jgi:hypothetical protein
MSGGGEEEYATEGGEGEGYPEEEVYDEVVEGEEEDPEIAEMKKRVQG